MASRRGYSDHITKQQVENLRAAVTFAHQLGYPLNLCIDINWSRTWLGDDPDGRVLDGLMELIRKWLRHKDVAVFAQIEVRECPAGIPNAHVMVHCPRPLMRALKGYVREVLTRLTGHLDNGAVSFRLVGRGHSTLEAALGKLAYLSKGVDRAVAAQLGIRWSPQGRIYGKRVSISQDISWAARQRYVAKAERQERLIRSLQGEPTGSLQGEECRLAL